MQEELVITVKNTTPYAFILLDGFVNMETSYQLSKVIEQISLDHEVSRYIFDLTKMGYISSAGIGLFMDLWEKTSQKKGGICFINIQPSVRRVFELVGFMKFFGDAGSLDMAKNFFNINENISETEGA